MPWSQHIEFIKNLWGYYSIVGNIGVITSPASYPGIPNLIPESVSVRPLLGENDAPSTPIPLVTLSIATVQYGFARVEVSYAPVQTDTDQGFKPEVPSGTYLQYSGRLSNRLITIPGSGFRWKHDGTTFDPQLNVGYRVPSESFSLKWSRVPLPPWTAIRAKAGLINSAEFMGYPAGTVMFDSAERDREYQVADTGLWQLVYHFSVQIWESTVTPGTKYGWNYLFNQRADGSGEHIQEFESLDGKPTYQTTSFDDLFDFE